MLIQLDIWLLNQFELFTHWFQKLTGKDCFWLAKGTLLIFWIIFPSRLTLSFTPSAVLLLGFGVAASTSSLIFDERRTKGLQLKNLGNPKKTSSWWMLRIFVVFFTLHGPIFGDMDSLAFFFYACSFYFAACDSLPPGRSKVREVKGTRVKEKSKGIHVTKDRAMKSE